MNTLSFNILPTDESRDHQARILIDGEDILGEDYLGMDPPDFFGQKHLLGIGTILIGRCGCGVVGCCDYPVFVNIRGGIITWTDGNGLDLSFDRANYEKAILSAGADHSWESNERRVERLTSEILKNTVTGDGHQFDWTSARIKENVITVSYSRAGEQRLYEFGWDGRTDQSAVQGGYRFLAHGPIKKT